MTRLLTAGLILLAPVAVAAVIPQSADADSGAHANNDNTHRAPSSLAPMLERATPAVVNIATEGSVEIRQNPLFNDPFFQRFFNLPRQPLKRKIRSLGSGVIVDAARGLALTNHHVIANADEITVTLRDGRQFKARKLGADPDTDVALIQIPADDLVALPRSDSDRLRVGDFVVAIGNPFGLGQTVTSGIVSALGRRGLGIEGYEDFIQTDASINPGNSGGALVNLNGELVGINTAIFSRSGGNIGIGFAIPINLALQISEQLLEKGAVERGFIGIRVQDLNPELAAAFGIAQDSGVKSGAVINSVLPGSPAARAGLQAGDVIIAIDGKPVGQAGDVRNHIGLAQVGDRLAFDMLRDGQRQRITAQVVAHAASAAAVTPNAGNNSGRPDNPKLHGATFGDIPRSHPRYGEVSGVAVVDMQPGTVAWQAGLRPGDVITSVNRRPVRGLRAFLAAVGKRPGTLLLRVVRGNAAAFLVLQ